MELKSIVQFLNDKSILITGGTGFLAKVMVEKILRVQPNVKKLYLLIRAENQEEAFKRFQRDLVGKDLFRILKEKYGEKIYAFLSEKVTPVAGDIASENMGVRDSNLITEMRRHVDVVVNSAATTKFYERYDVALGINTFGTKHVSTFVTKCENIKLFLHISTAYVSHEEEGLVLEKEYKFGEALYGKSKLDIDEEKAMIEENLKQLMNDKATDAAIASAMKKLGIERAKHHGCPNTYVFTKAMGEMLLSELRGDVPVVIIRPTIVSSTYKEPFPGWIEGIRTIDSICVGFLKGMISCFPGNPDCILDIVPADIVVNAMIVAMATHVNQSNSRIIYHVGSSASNPIKLHQILDWSCQYFSKHPYVNNVGRIVKPSDFTLLTSPTSFQEYMALRYGLPLKGLIIANTILCHVLDGLCDDLSRKLKLGLHYADLYRPYVFSKIIYDDVNLKKLHIICKENTEYERQIFFFDPSCINWEDYYMDTHLPGLLKYTVE